MEIDAIKEARELCASAKRCYERNAIKSHHLVNVREYKALPPFLQSQAGLSFNPLAGIYGTDYMRTVTKLQ